MWTAAARSAFRSDSSKFYSVSGLGIFGGMRNEAKAFARDMKNVGKRWAYNGKKSNFSPQKKKEKRLKALNKRLSELVENKDRVTEALAAKRGQAPAGTLPKTSAPRNYPAATLESDDFVPLPSDNEELPLTRESVPLSRYFEDSTEPNPVAGKKRRRNSLDSDLNEGVKATASATTHKRLPEAAHSVDSDTPWLPSSITLPSDPAKALSIELPFFAAHVLPTPQEDQLRTNALQMLRNAVGKTKPGWTAHAGGSWASGTGFWYADLDCVMVPKSQIEEEGSLSLSENETSDDSEPGRTLTKSVQNKALFRVKKYLLSTHSPFLVSRARVPVLKLTDPSGIEIDLTCAGKSLLRSSMLARQLAGHHEHLVPMVLLVKRVLKQEQLDEPFTGGLGGYPTILLVAWWLSWSSAWRSANSSLGHAAIEFFRTFGGVRRKGNKKMPDNLDEDPAVELEDILRNCTFVLDSRPPFTARTMDGPHQVVPRSLHLQDPKDSGNNAARAFKLLPAVRRVFAHAYNRLISEKGPQEVSVLGRVVAFDRAERASRAHGDSSPLSSAKPPVELLEESEQFDEGIKEKKRKADDDFAVRAKSSPTGDLEGKEWKAADDFASESRPPPSKRPRRDGPPPAKRPRRDDPPAFNPKLDKNQRAPKHKALSKAGNKSGNNFGGPARGRLSVSVAGPWVDELDVDIGKRYKGWRGEEQELEFDYIPLRGGAKYSNKKPPQQKKKGGNGKAPQQKKRGGRGKSQANFNSFSPLDRTSSAMRY